jgi:hypothetical protein
MTKEQEESQTSFFHALDKNSYYIDDKHIDHPETGYIYIEDGKMMVQPLWFKEDKIIMDGEDVTEWFFEPFEISGDTASFIISLLKENGYSFDGFKQKE